MSDSQKTSSHLHALASANPVFNGLPAAELEAILAVGFSRNYPKGRVLADSGDLWPYLFLVIKGKISAYKESSEGRSLLVRTIHPGEVFWGLAFFDPQAGMPVRLLADLPSQVHLWERERLKPYLLKNGALTFELCRQMVQRMLRASDIVEGLAFQPVAGRVARFLLEQSPSDRVPSPREMTLDQMAAHIGTTREMVCRYLRNFSEEGLIDITRTEYYITDRERLKQLSAQVKG